MKRSIIFALTWTCLLAASGCKKEAPAPTSPPEGVAQPDSVLVQRAQGLVGQLKQKLVGALQQALKTGGPVQAINVCRDQAPELAKALAAPGVRLGRTSDKLRNPKNAPQAWHKPLLEELSKVPAKPPAHRTAKLADGSFGYAEPLYVQPLCLSCHGAKLAPEVAAVLKEKYPEDQATGYVEGQFRGIAWFRLELTAR